MACRLRYTQVSQEFLALRRSGWSTSQLGRHFHLPQQTMHAWLSKHAPELKGFIPTVGNCAICGVSSEELRKNSSKYCQLIRDHSHVTGENRGLLCYPCNIGLGKFRDSPKLLWRAIKYLDVYEPIKHLDTHEKGAA